MTVIEKSCGYIAYRETAGRIFYLLIHSLNGDWGFPKGHTEPGESEYETARRELKEETGTEAIPLKGFRRMIEYPLPNKPGVTKQAVYFIGRCSADRLTPQEEEVSEALFLPLDEALALLTFDSAKVLLKEADEFIRAASAAIFPDPQ